MQQHRLRWIWEWRGSHSLLSSGPSPTLSHISFQQKKTIIKFRLVLTTLLFFLYGNHLKNVCNSCHLFADILNIKAKRKISLDENNWFNKNLVKKQNEDICSIVVISVERGISMLSSNSGLVCCACFHANILGKI